MAKADIRDRLKDAASEFADLVRSGASKDQLRNGANGKCGVNQLVELFIRLPDTGQSAEFKIAP